VLAFFPDIRERNPYQTMLYGSLDERGVAVVPADDPATLADAPATGPLVFHVHWTAPILRGARTELDAMRRYGRFVDALDALKARGARIAWTVHNVLPHECRFPHLEAELCQEIAVRADLVHVMCEGTVGAVAPYYVLPPARVRVVPHGSYVGVYPNAASQEEARGRLALGSEDSVLCFLGGIRAYKGVGRLIDAFEALAEARPESRLIVAGPAGAFEGLQELAARCAGHPRILARLERVPDEEIQVYMNAADVVVLPHRTGLNSGALMLALSFARPVVAPRVGCIGELVTPDVGLTFDPDAPGDLEAALMRAGDLKDRRYRDAALAKARAYPPQAMAEDFAKLVAELIDAAVL
jgi:glycosyltransferase involved in cell wall biosynthesis